MRALTKISRDRRSIQTPRTGHRTSDGHHSQDGRDMARGTDQPSDINLRGDAAIYIKKLDVINLPKKFLKGHFLMIRIVSETSLTPYPKFL